MADLPQNSTPNWLTDSVKQFIESAVITGDMALPFFYPSIVELDTFQVGFRINGLTSESLVSAVAGEWQPTWYVIARNQFDEPFFIDINEALQGFPVYYASHGAGRWDAVQAAPSLARFGQILSTLQLLIDNDAAAARYITTETDSTNALWQEVLDGRLSRQQQLAEEIEATHVETPVNVDDWQQGTLILTDVGLQKLKVAQYIQQLLGVSPQQELALIARGELVIGEDYLIPLCSQKNKLIALGATVIFRQNS